MFFLVSIHEWHHHMCHHWWCHDVPPPRTPWNDQYLVRCNKIHESKFSTIYITMKVHGSILLLGRVDWGLCLRAVSSCDISACHPIAPLVPVSIRNLLVQKWRYPLSSIRLWHCEGKGVLVERLLLCNLWYQVMKKLAWIL